MAQATCSVEDCDIPVPCPGGARGMCQMHYKRWKKHGDPLKVFPRGYRGLTDEQRFWPKVNKNGPVPANRPDLGPCWVWQKASRNKYGHGVFSIASTPEQPDRKPQLIGAHRFSYELLVGPIPDGLEPDHLCRNPPCVNPSHLEAVTHRVNVLRGIAPPAQHARKETCPEGHDYDVVRANGKRRCSACDKAGEQERGEREQGPLVECACGCGTTFTQMRGGRTRRYVHGHNMRRAA